MIEDDRDKLPVARLLVLAATVVAVALLAFAYGTAAGGASILEALLPDGERPLWYWTRMESSGYEVTSVSYAHDHHLQYQVVKDEEWYEVQLELDAGSGTAVAVTIVEGPPRGGAPESGQ